MIIGKYTNLKAYIHNHTPKGNTNTINVDEELQTFRNVEII